MKSFFHAFLAYALLGGAAGCKTSPTEESSPPVVKVQSVIARETEIMIPVRSSGKLTSRAESKLSFKTGGIIDRILVDEGQNVEEGQLLAQLNLEEIRSQGNQANLVLKKSERDFQRAENLYMDSVATLEQFQDSRTALEVARSNARILD